MRFKFAISAITIQIELRIQARMNSTVVWLHAFVDTLYLAFVPKWNEPKIGSTWFQKRLNLQGTRFLRYCHRFLRPLDGEVVAKKTFQTVLSFARRGLFPSFLQMSTFAYFPQTLFFDAGPENCRTRWGKTSSEGSAGSPCKQKSQFYMGIYRSKPQNWAYFPSFWRFWPLGFWDRFKKRARNADFLHSTAFA